MVKKLAYAAVATLVMLALWVTPASATEIYTFTINADCNSYTVQATGETAVNWGTTVNFLLTYHLTLTSSTETINVDDTIGLKVVQEPYNGVIGTLDNFSVSQTGTWPKDLNGTYTITGWINISANVIYSQKDLTPITLVCNSGGSCDRGCGDYGWGDWGCGDYGHGDYGWGDWGNYDRGDYGWGDNDRGDYGCGDYGWGDYGRYDYSRYDYGHYDYGNLLRSVATRLFRR